MFHLSYSNPCPIQGTLHLTRNPFMSGLGYYKDVEGVMWDIHGVIGRKTYEDSYVQARRLDDSPSYYGTADWDSQYGTHKWMPYKVNIVSKNKINIVSKTDKE